MENIGETDIIVTLVIGTLMMFVMAGVIVFAVVKYQQKVLKQKEELRLAEKKFQTGLLEASIIAAENEREILAKNLHDEIGTLIQVVRMNNRQVKKKAGAEFNDNGLMDSSAQILQEISDNIKAICNGLMSPTLIRLGFIRGLMQLVTQINLSGAVKIQMKQEDLSMRFDSKAEIQMFRVCKEVLNNILKHSNATEIILDVTYGSGVLNISMEYDGRGINDSEVQEIMKQNKGLGLKSIYGRLQVIGGKINYFYEKKEKARVLISIPVNIENKT